jgi:hypothetical protein
MASTGAASALTGLLCRDIRHPQPDIVYRGIQAVISTPCMAIQRIGHSRQERRTSAFFAAARVDRGGFRQDIRANADWHMDFVSHTALAMPRHNTCQK